MEVLAIKNSEPKNVSIPLTMTAGGAAGLALRHFIPVWEPEMDTFMFNKSESIKQDNAYAAKKSFVKSVQEKFKKEPENKSFQLFLDWVNAKTEKAVQAAENKISKAPQNIQNAVTDLRNDLSVKIQAAKNLTEANIKNAAKQARSVSGFLLPGIALGALAGYAYNVIGTISDNRN